MDLSFIQDQLDNFATFGGAIEDIFKAIVKLFGGEGDVDGGTLDQLSSYESSVEGENGPKGDSSSEFESSESSSEFEGSSVKAEADLEA
ncbi:PorH family porin [Corynebacterium marinum]|uniref:Uncharacterized protein n=1 Tax=Corynebacterium marinum DSM 44953 TaxID=1224162 RepID=A0A0B6TYJ6_9CORY|nr:PorH family porin [Corynebacterium marinum]AJK69776.1 hypothetical protein B840_11020 [Corynebacterium marinum DSM 44953]GGO18728.1 hypothetical protein GCM10010980_17160 [Corynebacterium marinum]